MRPRVLTLAVCLFASALAELSLPHGLVLDSDDAGRHTTCELHLLQAKAARILSKPNASLPKEKPGLDRLAAGGSGAGNASLQQPAHGAVNSSDPIVVVLPAGPASARREQDNSSDSVVVVREVVEVANPDSWTWVRNWPLSIWTWPFWSWLPSGSLDWECKPAEGGGREHCVLGRGRLLWHILGAVFFMSSILIFAAFLVLVNGRVVIPDEGVSHRPRGIEHLESDQFHFGLFDFDECCGRDAELCCCAWFCPGIQWADTLSQPRLGMGTYFWCLIIFYAVTHGLSVITMGGSALVFLVSAVYFRHKLRRTFGLKRTWGSTFFDALAWLFCAPCALVQETRQVVYVPMRPAS